MCVCIYDTPSKCGNIVETHAAFDIKLLPYMYMYTYIHTHIYTYISIHIYVSIHNLPPNCGNVGEHHDASNRDFLSHSTLVALGSTVAASIKRDTSNNEFVPQDYLKMRKRNTLYL